MNFQCENSYHSEIEKYESIAKCIGLIQTNNNTFFKGILNKIENRA